MGLSAFTPSIPPEQSTTYLCLAETYGLHITGDRDFYGETVRHDTTLTPIPLDLD